jgi:hypothetical protein
MKRRALPLTALLLAAACGEPAPRAPAAPVEPRAAWVLDPPRLRLGDVATLERVVVTPPGYRVAAFVPPAAPGGFWLLDAETPPPERLASRWIQRTRLRIRAREPGRFEWPGGTLDVEAPGGETRPLAIAALPIEVVSVLPDAPDRLTPFGVRELPESAAGAGALWAAAGAGALAALGALATGRRMVRRARARRAAPSAPAPSEPPEPRARAGFAGARAALPADARAAADMASAALRRFVMQRFGAPAHARTTEELETTAPPFALSSRWPRLLALLRALDGERFAPPARGGADAARVGELLDAAEAFVEQSQPPAAAR